MKLKKIVACSLFAFTTAHSASFDLTDMQIEPARPGSTVEVTGEVVSEGSFIVADLEQDGLSVAHQQLIESNSDGVRFIQVGSGSAILATGTDTYRVYDNINATMLSKKAAYNRAFMRAKQSLVQDFNGLLNSCESAAVTQLDMLDTGNDSLANTGIGQTSECSDIVQGSLSGFATYDVYDNDIDKTVRVTIISSPKTRSAIRNTSGAVYSTNNPNEAFKIAVSDISSGLLPPVGAKVIRNAETDETIVLGYGSAIIRQNSNPNASRQIRQAAERQSQSLSRNALIATMTGEEVFWKGGFSEGMVETTEQFELDPELNDPSKAAALDEERSLFLSVASNTEDFRTAASGRIPPGVKSRTFVSADGFWAYTVSIYSPSLEASSRDASADMNARTSGSTGNRSSKEVRSYGGLNDNQQNPTGPSGRIGSDADF